MSSSSLPAEMRAVVASGYGGPSVLRLVSLPVPVAGPGQVLVRVVATGVNLSDWECLRGTPLYARVNRRPVLGSDIAGVVVAVGPDVAALAVGDEVFGDNIDLKGGFAEYAVVPVRALVRRPAGLSWELAAALPQPAAIAWSAMADAVAGSRVLINGAGGGSGALALQLARLAGAHVTGVDNAGKLSFMRSMGADAVADYRATDPTRLGPFDRVLDLVASRSMLAWARALARGGRYSLVGGSMSALLRAATVAPVLGWLSGRRLRVLFVRQGPQGFSPVVERVVAGDIRMPIDHVYALDEVPLALAHVGEGRALGKVVVRVG